MHGQGLVYLEGQQVLLLLASMKEKLWGIGQQLMKVSFGGIIRLGKMNLKKGF